MINSSINLLSILNARGEIAQNPNLSSLLKLGQVLDGLVLQALPKGKALVDFEGAKILVQHEGQLKEGQKLKAQVERLSPNPVLKLTDLPINVRTAPKAGTTNTVAQPPGNKTAINPSPASGKQVSPQNLENLNPALRTAGKSASDLPLTKNSASPARITVSQGTTQTDRAVISGQINLKRDVITNGQLKSLDLREGQEAGGKIVKFQTEGRAIVKLEAGRVVVKLPNPISEYKAGDPVTLKAVKVTGGYKFESRLTASNAPTLLTENLKPYVPAKQTFGEMAGKLRETAQQDFGVNNSGAKNAALIKPELINEMQKTLDVLLGKNKDETINAKTIQKRVDLSGINYEAKVRNVVKNAETPPSNSSKRILGGDLKGQLIQLTRHLKEGGGPINLSPGAPPENPAQGFVRQALSAIENIELTQLSNHLSRQENQPVLLQIPGVPFAEDKTLKLYFKPEEGGKGASGEKKEGEYSLVFLLDFTALGSLRMDAKISQNKLAVNISAENRESAAFINKHLPLLKTKLEELGYEVDATCCEQKKEAMEIEDPLARLMIDNHTSLVDIKT